MRVNYKGYEIEVFRDMCLGGWEQLYYSIFREEDGFECVTGFVGGEEKVRDMVKYLKERVDNEEKDDDPWGEQKTKEQNTISGDVAKGIQRVLDSTPEYTALRKGSDIYLEWGRPGIGFGQIIIYEDAHGNLKCENEGMSKDFIKQVLTDLVDQVEFND